MLAVFGNRLFLRVGSSGSGQQRKNQSAAKNSHPDYLPQVLKIPIENDSSIAGASQKGMRGGTQRADQSLFSRY